MPIREFMFHQTREKDLALFVKLSKIEQPKTRADVPTYVLIPAFIISRAEDGVPDRLPDLPAVPGDRPRRSARR